jgi:RNA polymerase sigma-70 factor, ECF subfamily
MIHPGEVPYNGGPLETAVTVSDTIVDPDSRIYDYKQDLIGAAYRITCDMAAAQDIVQDVYLNFLQSNSAFKKLSSEKTYLYRIVINKSIDHRRRQRRWWSVLEQVDRENVLRNAHTGDGDSDKIELVHAALGKIPDEFRIPLLLADIDGLSYEEIAKTLKISLNTVRSRIFRCREKLRKALTKAGYNV